MGDDLAVDTVDEHEATRLGRVLGRVEQDPPGGAAAQPAPPQLRRGVSHREAHLLAGGHERIALIRSEVPARGEVVGAEQHQEDPGEQEPSVDEDAGALACDAPSGDAPRTQQQVQVPRDAPTVVVREHIRSDEGGRIQILRQLVADIVITSHVSDGIRETPPQAIRLAGRRRPQAGQVARRRSAASSRLIGRTRVSATTAMKFASPCHRGTQCTCR